MSEFKNKPNFIVVDGIDGAGKSLLIEKIKGYFYNRSIKCKQTHIVESTFLASEIKKYLKSVDAKEASATTLGFLFAAAINDVVEKVIEPANLAGEVVISDRYTMSTRVYQAESKYIDTICDIVDSVLIPDITFVLDAPPSILKSRILARGATEIDVTESLSNEVINDRRRKYARLARISNKDTYVIDASGTPDDVAQQVFNILNTYY